MENATQIRRKPHSHTEEEKEWARQEIANHGTGTKSIRENNTLERYNERFGKELSIPGMYAWLKYIEDPNYGKGRSNGSKGKGKKEQLVFTKSNYLAYMNGTIAGFESKDDLVAMMEKNKILSNEIKIFKALPIEVKYAVSFDG